MLKQIYEEARSKMVAECDQATALKVAEVTNQVIRPKLEELENAKNAAINEKAAAYNASLVSLKEQYDASVMALRVQYEKGVADLKSASDSAKSAFQEAQLNAAKAEVASRYSAEIAKLDKLIRDVDESI